MSPSLNAPLPSGEGNYLTSPKEAVIFSPLGLSQGFNGFCTTSKMTHQRQIEVVQKPLDHRGKPGGDLITTSKGEGDYLTASYSRGATRSTYRGPSSLAAIRCRPPGVSCIAAKR